MTAERWKASGPGHALPLGDTEPTRAGSQPADYAINARVRQVLNRRWVRLEGLEVGTTGGVVLLKGHLEREPAGLPEAEGGVARQRFLWRLRSELKAIPGVVDVVMETEENERTDAP